MLKQTHSIGSRKCLTLNSSNKKHVFILLPSKTQSRIDEFERHMKIVLFYNQVLK